MILGKAQQKWFEESLLDAFEKAFYWLEMYGTGSELGMHYSIVPDFERSPPGLKFVVYGCRFKKCAGSDDLLFSIQ